MESFEKLSAKELKVIATEQGLEFSPNASKVQMLELLTTGEDLEETTETESDESQVEYTVLSNLKRNGKFYIAGDSIEEFEGIEELVEEGVIE